MNKVKLLLIPALAANLTICSKDATANDLKNKLTAVTNRVKDGLNKCPFLNDKRHLGNDKLRNAAEALGWAYLTKALRSGQLHSWHSMKTDYTNGVLKAWSSCECAEGLTALLLPLVTATLATKHLQQALNAN